MVASKDIADPFLYKLLGGTAGALGIVLALFSWHLADYRIPQRREMISDLRTSAPLITQLVMETSWLQMVLSVLTIASGIVSVITPRRSLLLATFVLAFLAVSSLLLADYAMEDTFLWMLIQALT